MHIPPYTAAQLQGLDEYLAALGDALAEDYGLLQPGAPGWLAGGVNAYELSRTMTQRLHAEFEHGYESPQRGATAEPGAGNGAGSRFGAGDAELSADMLPLHAAHQVRGLSRSAVWCVDALAM